MTKVGTSVAVAGVLLDVDEQEELDDEMLLAVAGVKAVGVLLEQWWDTEHVTDDDGDNFLEVNGNLFFLRRFSSTCCNSMQLPLVDRYKSVLLLSRLLPMTGS